MEHLLEALNSIIAIPTTYKKLSTYFLNGPFQANLTFSFLPFKYN